MAASDLSKETGQPEPESLTPEEQRRQDALSHLGPMHSQSLPHGDLAAGSPERDNPGDRPDGQVPRRHGTRGDQVIRGSFERPPGGLASDEQDRPSPKRQIDSVAAESRDESLKAIGSWIVETITEICAHAINPVLGHLVSIALKVKEVWGDAEALADPASPADLHVPLLSLAPGVRIDLNVHLPGRDGARGGGPPVSGFIAPGTDDLFGGWAIESDERPEAAGEHAQPPDRDSRKQGALIPCDLSKAVPAVDAAHRAAILRDAVPQLLDELLSEPELADKPMIVAYDRRAGLGFWMIQPALAAMVKGWQIEIRADLETGLMTVVLR